MSFTKSAIETKIHFKWIKEIAQQSQDMTVEAQKAFCEYHYALPIFKAKEPKMYEEFFASRSYEHCIELLEKAAIDITDDFTDEEMEEYLNKICELANDRGFLLTNANYWGE